MLIGEIRAIARNLMPQFVAQGMSSRAITSYLKSNFGGAYRRQTLLGDIREFTHLAKYQKATERVAGESPFPKHLMDERELRRERKYFIRGQIRYRDLETGEETDAWGSMYTDTYGSKEDWESQFMDYQVESESNPDKVAIGFKIISVSHYTQRPY